MITLTLEDIKVSDVISELQKHGIQADQTIARISFDLEDEIPDNSAKSPNIVQAIRELVEPIGGVELELPPREQVRAPISFDE